MPHDASKYPADWKQISVAVCWGRAQGRCENCGALNGHPHPITGGTVVLAACHTCACDPLCGDLDHLKSMCQRCHLEFDSDLHVRSLRAHQRQNMLEAGQLDLLDNPELWG